MFFRNSYNVNTVFARAIKHVCFKQFLKLLPNHALHVRFMAKTRAA